MSIVMLFSEAERAAAVTRAQKYASGHTGVELPIGVCTAIADDGTLVQFTSAYDSNREAGAGSIVDAFEKFPDTTIAAKVSELRVVFTNNGTPANRDKWAEWGYQPENM